MTGDPAAHDVIVTVNEDGNSSLYTIDPGAAQPLNHFTYNEALPHNGGTDAISVMGGHVFVSASAPGTTGLPAPQATYPAVYTVSLDPTKGVATVSPLFFDEDTASVANLPAPAGPPTTHLGLTDPDSNAIVPRHAARFGGDFMLDSQGDQQLIFVHPSEPSATARPALAVLSLSQAIDDTTWPHDNGTLFASDSTDDTVVAIAGRFPDGPVAVATPCGSNTAPSTCPAPPTFPANYLAVLNPFSGLVNPLPVSGATFVPQGGLLFVPDRDGRDPGQSS